MMYPVRTTTLLTVDEETAKKFLRDEADVERANHMASHQRNRIGLLIRGTLHGIGHLMLVFGQHLDQFDRSPCETQVGVTPGK